MRGPIRTVACIGAMIFASVSLFLSSPALAQAASEVTHGQSISPNYKSWSLFLVCNPEWLVTEEAAQENMRALHEAFSSFGKIIGSANLAVWFTKPAISSSQANYETYDADEAGDYCASYGLSANESPYIVVTTAYPTKTGARGNYSAISLNRLDNANRLRLLGTISDRIRMSDFRAEQFDSDRYWRRWAQVLDESARAMGRLVEAIKFTVDARAVKVEFDGTKISR